jgi:hypothetical protein
MVMSGPLADARPASAKLTASVVTAASAGRDRTRHNATTVVATARLMGRDMQDGLRFAQRTGKRVPVDQRGGR